MEVFTMVAIIVVAACAAGVAKEYFKSKEARGDEAVHEDVAAELDELRERVEVLEKIVTDNRYQLEREISDLERRA